MELRILSLNVRLWTKENNIFKPHFWLWRTFKQARLFRRENPDIICLQEVERPVGKFLLGLWGYKTIGGGTRIPIYVRKSIDALPVCINGGMPGDNGHGTNHIWLWSEEYLNLQIVNCHLSWETDKHEKEYEAFLPNSIVCGDMNVGRDRFIENFREYAGLDDEHFLVYPKMPAGPTYISYAEPLKYRGDIDQFAYIGMLPPKAEVTILPDKVSDHFPILAKFEI